MSLAQGNNTPTRPRIEPGSPDPESDALTTRPVRSPAGSVCCFLEQETFTPQNVLVIPRNRWLRLNKTEKLFTGTLNHNPKKKKISGKNELVSPRRLIQYRVLNINCYSFSHLFYTQSEQLNIQITHSHRYNSADLQVANKTIIEGIKTL